MNFQHNALITAARAVLDSAVVETFNGTVEVSEESLVALEAALAIERGQTTEDDAGYFG